MNRVAVRFASSAWSLNPDTKTLSAKLKAGQDATPPGQQEPVQLSADYLVTICREGAIAGDTDSQFIGWFCLVTRAGRMMHQSEHAAPAQAIREAERAIERAELLRVLYVTS